MNIKALSILLILLVLLTGCGGGAADTGSAEAPAAEAQSEAASDSPQAAAPQGLSGEYQALANDILAAVEKGYHYQGEGMWGGLGAITRQGRYVMSGDPEEEGFMVTYNIGLVGEKGYHVNIVEGEMTDIYGNDMPDAGLDLAGKYLQYLMGMLEAYSSGSLYEDSAHTKWEVMEVTMGQEGGATVVTVKTQLPSSKQEPTVETFTIVDGLLEALSVTTPYLNSGEESVTTYTYLSRGPVDGSRLAALYEEAKAQAQ